MSNILDDSWLEILNKNAKWSVGFLVRAILLTVCVVLFSLFMKCTGLFNYMWPSDSDKDVIKITPGNTINTSPASKISYKPDIQDIDKTIQMLKNLEMRKDKNEGKDSIARITGQPANDK